MRVCQCVCVCVCAYMSWGGDCDSSVIKTYDGEQVTNWWRWRWRWRESQVAAAVNLRLFRVRVCVCVCVCVCLCVLFVTYAQTPMSMQSMHVCSFMCDRYTFRQQTATFGIRTAPRLSALTVRGAALRKQVNTVETYAALVLY